MNRGHENGRSLTFALLALASAGTLACGEPGTDPGSAALPHPTEMGLPAVQFQRPDPDGLRVRLINGMTAYVVEDSESPLVTLGAVIAAGTLDAEVAGAAEALAQTWTAGGTRLRSRASVMEALQAMVADFQVIQSAEETEIRLNVPREDFQPAVELLADLLREPRVAGADIRAAVAQGRPTEPAGYEGSLPLAVDAFHDHLYQDHPLGRRATPALTSGRVVAYHQQFVTPGSVTLYVAGGVRRDTAERALTGSFADWGAAQATERTQATRLQSDSRRDVLLYPVDKLQGWVVIGHELPVVPIEEEAALHVMNYILGGGHFDTRLFRAARDRRGLTNDASGFLNPGIRAPGSYTFRTYGRPEVVPLLVHLTLQEIERMRNAPVSERELFVAKGALADGEYTLGFRGADATARTFAQEWSRYRGHERSASYPDRIGTVTIEEVQSAARNYLLPERLDIVVVGPMADILNAAQVEDELPLRAIGMVSGAGAGR